MAYTELTGEQEREVLRDLAGARTPRTQGLFTAITAAAPAGGSGATAGAYDSAANRDIAIAAINNNRTRINEIEKLLVDLGLLSAEST
jgi:hypothetical protein